MTVVGYSPLVGAQSTNQPEAASYHGRWLVADNDRWINPHECSALHTISVEFKLGYLVLRAPGMPRLDIVLDVLEDDDSVRVTLAVAGRQSEVVDEGELASAWISNVVGRSCSIMKVHPASSDGAWPPNTWTAGG